MVLVEPWKATLPIVESCFMKPGERPPKRTDPTQGLFKDGKI